MSTRPMEFDFLLPRSRYSYDRTGRVWLRADAGTGFAYTDGANFEARLLQIMREAADRSVLSPEMLACIADWPTRYHLSPRRSNLLRPLETFLRGRRVLEVGAGCGALTRYLGEIGAKVCAVEGSVARAKIAAARCAGLDNVTVVADALQNIEVQPAFDAVTLVGVLEYARIFFPARDEVKDPVDAMLACARAFLRPGGVLLVGIENQLGLKYFAGCREDHVAMPMFGIEDAYSDDGVVTFGRAELADRLARAGLRQQQWLFPFPDYKLPVAVLTERGVAGGDGADLGPLAAGSVVADLQVPSRFTFSLERAWRPVMRNRLAGELANSFLAVASAEATEAVPVDVLGWHFAVERAPRFAKQTVFSVDGGAVWVDSSPLLRGEGDARDPASCGLSMHLGREPFVPGELWHHALIGLLNRPGWTADEVAAWIGRWMSCLSDRESRVSARRQGLDTMLPGILLDAVPRNMLVRGSEARFIDLEWDVAGGVSLGHLCYRAIVQSIQAVSSVAPPARAEDVSLARLLDCCMTALGFPGGGGRAAEWQACEREFQILATGVDVPRDYSAIAAYRLPVRS